MATSIELSDADLDGVLEFSISIAKKAGAVILEGSRAIRSSRSIKTKMNSVDLVTEWDVKVEELVFKEIADKYPGFKSIGEESYSSGKRDPLTDDPTFCIDPIDGTTNFIHGFPFVCISIGFIYKRHPVIGVIYNPFLDQLYTGQKGKGSFLNGTTRLPLYPPAPLTDLSQCSISIEWSPARWKEIIDLKARSFGRLAGDPKTVEGGKMAHSLKSIGCAAINFALVAAGSNDIFHEIGCWSWDVCAGAVIAQEAGCFVSGPHGAPRDNVVDEKLLTGRKYIVVRAIEPEEGSTALEGQIKLVEDFYSVVEDYDP